MENLELSSDSFWNNKKVLITGHTGFKGSWLSLWLYSLGAKVFGYAFPPEEETSLFNVLNLQEKIEKSFYGDIIDKEIFEDFIIKSEPEIIFHLAAQPLVRVSYLNPLKTLETNIMGTSNLLNVAMKIKSLKSIVNITSDKCYENSEKEVLYNEDDPLGGEDPYSASKACAEIVTTAFRKSFLNEKNIFLASARAGNVIGGGDWAKDRLIPDLLKAIENNKELIISYPEATRPWQHVLEPLKGYMILAERLFKDGSKFSEGWNFGPNISDNKTVMEVVKLAEKISNKNFSWKLDRSPNFKEASLLNLDCAKSKQKLGWNSKLNLEQALGLVFEWQLAFNSKSDMSNFTLDQIKNYQNKFNEN